MDDLDNQNPIPDENNDENNVETLNLSSRERYLSEKRRLSVEQALSDLDHGWKIGIYRTRPTWIQVGYLETVQYDPANPIDLDYVREEHGGGSYCFKFMDERGRIQFVKTESISGKPKQFGVDIEHPSVVAAQEKRSSQYEERSKPNDINETILTALLQSQNAANTENMRLAREAMQKSSPVSPRAQLSEMAGMIDTVRNMGVLDDGGGAGDITPMIGGILEMLKGQQQQQYKPQVVHPVSVRGQRQRKERTVPDPIPEPIPGPKKSTPEPKSIAEFLANGTAEETAKIIEDAVSQMDPEKFTKLGSLLGLSPDDNSDD